MQHRRGILRCYWTQVANRSLDEFPPPSYQSYYFGFAFTVLLSLLLRFARNIIIMVGMLLDDAAITSADGGRNPAWDSISDQLKVMLHQEVHYYPPSIGRQSQIFDEASSRRGGRVFAQLVGSTSITPCF